LKGLLKAVGRLLYVTWYRTSVGGLVVLSNFGGLFSGLKLARESTRRDDDVSVLSLKNTKKEGVSNVEHGISLKVQAWITAAKSRYGSHQVQCAWWDFHLFGRRKVFIDFSVYSIVH
jgi:hypothetical protein